MWAMANRDFASKEECRQLLVAIKTTVEGLLANQTSNVWNTYGGLSRLSSIIDRILSHDLRTTQHGSDYWNFVHGIRILMPTLSPMLHRLRLVRCTNKERGLFWIQESLKEHNLSSQLESLMKDSWNIKAYYEESAFLRQDTFAKALIICLKAVESNTLALLAELDPNLSRAVQTKLFSEPEAHLHGHQVLVNRIGKHNVQNRTVQFGVHRYLIQEGHKRNMHSELVQHNDNKFMPLQKTCSEVSLQSSSFSANSDKLKCYARSKRSVSFCNPSHPLSTANLGESICDADSLGRLQQISNLEIVSSETSHNKGQLAVAASESANHCSPSPIRGHTFHKRSSSDTAVCHFVHVTEISLKATTSQGHDGCKNQSTSTSASMAEACTFVTDKGTAIMDPEGTQSIVPSNITGVTFEDGESISSLLHFDYNDEHSRKSSISGAEAVTLFNTTTPNCEKTLVVSEKCEQNSLYPKCNDLRANHNVGVTDKELSSIAHEKLIPVKRKSPSHVRSKSDVTYLRDERGSQWKDVNMPSKRDLPLAPPLQNELGAKDTSAVIENSSFRLPQQGQSLTSFLLSQDFHTCAELDKENAHFSISEALIAAFEQIKCSQTLKDAEDEAEESDEEIKHLKQRIRIRRREKLQEKVCQRTQLLSDGRTDTTSQTPSPASSISPQCSAGDNSSDDVDPLDTCLSDESEAESKLSTLQASGLSLSMASLYSDADITWPTSSAAVPDHNGNNSNSFGESTSCMSAESVALCLLKKFSEKQLPKASDLEWLVSEQDVAQRLLPLPTSWPVSPDEAESYPKGETRLRGNFEWAPPRPQIIFSIHPAPQRKVILARQNYRCAGCGTKIEQGFSKRCRYCEYLGKYFCPCCHNNNAAIIPGYVLRKWDFTKYPVSNFARDLLERIYYDPLYDLNDINVNLYRRSRILSQFLNIRLQLLHLKDFIRSCSRCPNLKSKLNDIPAYLYTSIHVYSLSDLVLVKMGALTTSLQDLVASTLAHITQCPLCEARGFICEFCKNSHDVIYPFELLKTVQCSECWSCYHRECFVPNNCPKCARIEARKFRELQTCQGGSTDEV